MAPRSDFKRSANTRAADRYYCPDCAETWIVIVLDDIPPCPDCGADMARFGFAVCHHGRAIDQPCRPCSQA